MAEGLRRYRDKDGDVWRETAPDSWCYYLSKHRFDAEEGPQEPEHITYSFYGLDDLYGPLTELDTEPTAAQPEPTAAKPTRTLHQHAAAISLALADADADGFHLDDGMGNAIDELDLNAEFGNYACISVPKAGG